VGKNPHRVFNIFPRKNSVTRVAVRERKECKKGEMLERSYYVDGSGAGFAEGPNKG